MKKKLTNNLSLKILSVILAVLLWLIVVNVSDPEKTTTIANIPITIINEDAITGQDKVYEVVAGKTATVQVTGPRTIIDSLEASSFTATADLSKMSMTNAVEVEVELVKISYRTKVDIDVETTMRIAVEDLVQGTYEVQYDTTGSIADGYVAFDTSLSEKEVVVTAPSSVMSKIASVETRVNLKNAKEDFTSKVQLNAYDNRGNVINAEENNITFSVREINVSVTVYPIKQIPIVYDINEENYPDAAITSTTASKTHVMIAGRNDVLSAINELRLDTSSLVITETQSSYELTYKLGELLPEGVYVYGDTDSVTLKVKTDAIITRTFTIPVSEIGIKSLGEGYSAAHEGTGDVTYTLRGKKSMLDKFNTDEEQLFVSTKDLGEGVYDLDVQMDLEDDIELITPITVKVKITLKDRPTESSSSEDTSGENQSSEESTSGDNEQSSESSSVNEAQGGEDIPADGGVE